MSIASCGSNWERRLKGKSRPYRRILIKLSGEALGGTEGVGIDQPTLLDIAGQIGEIHKLGVQIAIVLGGGNIYRGKSGEKDGTDRVTGDYMGMLATVINGLAFADTLESKGIMASVMTAFRIERVGRPFSQKEALKELEGGKIVIFAGGTGNPYFTTDTAAALRAVEIKADLLLKATKVDGVYDKDPEKHKNAKFYPEISYSEVLAKGLQVMDLTAITLCMENKLPLAVLNMRKKGNLKKAVLGESIGTIVRR